MTDSRYGDATPALYRGGLPIGADTLHTYLQLGTVADGMLWTQRRNGPVSTTKTPCPCPAQISDLTSSNILYIDGKKDDSRFCIGILLVYELPRCFES